MINTLISLLRLIPTGDNAQQFRYKIVGDSLEVYHDSKIAEHRFNQSNVASLLSLGMIVEVAVTFAIENQFPAQLVYAQDFLKEDLWLTISFQSVAAAVDLKKNEHFLSLLKERKTFRGFFKKSQFDFSEMNRQFAGKAVFVKKLPKAAFGLMLKMENMIFDDYEAFKHIEKWFRYSNQALHETKTGMSLANLNIDAFNGLLLKAIRRSYFLSVILRPYFKALNFFKVNALYRQSVGFGIITVDQTDDAGVIAAGRTLLKVWLKLTDLKMAMQPISSASLLPFEYVYRKANFLEKYESLLSAANEILRQSFRYDQVHGIWLFRFGVPDKTVNNKNQRSLRLAETDLILKN
ncbi:MAG: hypothetical protein H7256_01860 [Bdellovibrio sp.]|nr:hypothetical protein [Bdellovibrio sp.]